MGYCSFTANQSLPRKLTIARKEHFLDDFKKNNFGSDALGKVGAANLTKPNFKVVNWTTEKVEKHSYILSDAVKSACAADAAKL